MENINAIVAVLILVVAIAGCTGKPSSSDSTTITRSPEQSPVTTNKAATIIIKSVDDMLPTRSEIPTEFTLDGKNDVNLTVSAFESGKVLSTSKLAGSIGMVFVNYNLYKFSDMESSNAYYQSEVDRIKNLGGYTEIGNPISSKCFTFKEDQGFQARFATNLCIEKNIVFEIGVTSSNTIESPTSYMNSASKTLANKILS